MSDALFTIIVPTRHRDSYLEVALRSILTSAAELKRAHGVGTRVLVVDDAPMTDGTKHLAEALRVDYRRVEQHDGFNDPGAAIVLGVQAVDTKYQTIFGDDDVMLPRHLRAAYETLLQGWDVVSSSFMVTNADLVITRTVKLLPADLGDLVAGYTGVNDGSFVAHDDVKGCDWDVTLEGQMLVPIWGELLASGKTFTAVREPTWLYRKHGDNISRGALSEADMARRQRARDRLVDAVMRELGEIPPPRKPAMLAAQEAHERRIAHGHRALLRRVRNKAARVIAPPTFSPEHFAERWLRP